MYSKKLIYILTAYLSAIIVPVFADNTDDITSSGFKIQLNKLDPINRQEDIDVPG